MKRIFHLTNCNTCKRILNELNPGPEFELQDIRNHPLTVAQLEAMKNLTGSYEALFSRRAKLYRERGLNNEVLTEAIYRELLLEHYTFLQRPVIVNEGQIFVGSSKKTVAAAKASL
ncbi:MAG: ArsC/Spx/MgsR family protein [Gilvibacter sp.]